MARATITRFASRKRERDNRFQMMFRATTQISLLALICVVFWLFIDPVVSWADAEGLEFKGQVIIRKIAPLKVHDSRKKKSMAMAQAVKEGDPERLIILFETCANKGDGQCQIELAAGLSNLAQDDRIEKRPELQPRYFLSWYRAALESREWQRASMATFANFYGHGVHGFPKNVDLSKCWGVAAIEQTSVERKTKMAECRALELRLFGKDAPWQRK
jgi:hypothetical protein